MNKKLIAAAVSAAVVAPVTAYGEASFYGRINNAIDIDGIEDADHPDSTTDVSGVASRFGFKYSGDIGNGLTAHGRYEFGTVTDKEGPGAEDTRIATAGLSGAFGRVDIGNQWSAYFNTFGTLVSPTYSLGYYIYSSVGGAPFRSSNTIKYSNSFGPVSAELDVRLNESEEGGGEAEKIRGDGVGLGLSFAVTDAITIAAAFDSEDGLDDDDPSGDTDRIGVGIKGSFGGISAALGWQNYEVDNAAETDIDSLFFNVGGNIGEKTNWLVSYSTADDGRDVITDAGADNMPGGMNNNADTVVSVDDSEQLLWGVYHNIGGGLRLYYEATNVDIGDKAATPYDGTFADDNGFKDGTVHLIGMRVDF